MRHRLGQRTLLVIVALAGQIEAKDVTLSKRGLRALDWHPDAAGARVFAVRDTPTGVELDIRFQKTPRGAGGTLDFIASPTQGARKLAAIDLRGYDRFALTITLKAVNGGAGGG